MLDLLREEARAALWEDVPDAIRELVKEAAFDVLLLHAAFLELPVSCRSQIERVYYHPFRKVAHVLADVSALAEAEEKFGEVCPCTLTDVGFPDGYTQEPWMAVKAGEAPLRPLAQLTNVLPNPVNRMVGGPTPLAATLSGGLLGAGLGYGSGWLLEKLLPKKVFDRGKLRKVMALLGGGLGAIPGTAWGAVSSESNPERPGAGAWLHGWPMRDEDRPSEEPMEKQFAAQALEELRELMPGETGEAYKRADFANTAGGFGLPPIQTDLFNRVVWGDPRTPVDVRAATTGLVESASILRGGSNFVSPADIGRVAMGAGSGYTSGLLVGKALGALAGLKPEYQDKLQQAGIWAGVLSNVIPIAFRGV